MGQIIKYIISAECPIPLFILSYFYQFMHFFFVLRLSNIVAHMWDQPFRLTKEMAHASGGRQNHVITMWQDENV